MTSREAHAHTHRAHLQPEDLGARSLAPLFPEKSNLSEPLGEAWLYGCGLQDCIRALRWKNAGEAWQKCPWSGAGSQLAAVTEVPLLVKFIFPTDKLSNSSSSGRYLCLDARKGRRWPRQDGNVACGFRGFRSAGSPRPEARGGSRKFREGLKQGTLENLFLVVPVHEGRHAFVPRGLRTRLGLEW